ncbi:hypothetical protein VDS42_22590 [Xanthomonas campestris pv. campestris]|nr:hypothetical protein [Xanthomonas campestris pv. campestris]
MNALTNTQWFFAALVVSGIFIVPVLLFKFFNSTEDHPNTLIGMVFVFITVALATVWLNSGNEEKRLEGWVSYSKANCQVFEERIAPGQEDQIVTGLAVAPSGNGVAAVPAFGVTSGTRDRILAGWKCADGKRYVAEPGRVPDGFSMEDAAAVLRSAAPKVTSHE